MNLNDVAIPEPTGAECSGGAERAMEDGRRVKACWYPQMGGYVGKCLLVYAGGQDGCIDAYVWHDGEFPFSGEDRDFLGDPKAPYKIHHCEPGQFSAFGKLAGEFHARVTA